MPQHQGRQHQIRTLGRTRARHRDQREQAGREDRRRALLHALIRAAHKSGVDNISWNRQIWSVSKGGPRPWTGTYQNGAPKNPHMDHIHVEWTRDGSQRARLNFLELEIAILRTGFEDLARANQRFA